MLTGDFLTEHNFLHRLMEDTHDLILNDLEKKVRAGRSYATANSVSKTGQWHRQSGC